MSLLQILAKCPLAKCPLAKCPGFQHNTTPECVCIHHPTMAHTHKTSSTPSNDPTYTNIYVYIYIYIYIYTNIYILLFGNTLYLIYLVITCILTNWELTILRAMVPEGEYKRREEILADEIMVLRALLLYFASSLCVWLKSLSEIIS